MEGVHRFIKRIWTVHFLHQPRNQEIVLQGMVLPVAILQVEVEAKQSNLVSFCPFIERPSDYWSNRFLINYNVSVTSCILHYLVFLSFELQIFLWIAVMNCNIMVDKVL